MRTLALTVALLSAAFAPAPFPRPDRKSAPDDLKLIQGDWTRVGDDTHLRVKGNLVEFVIGGDSWRIKLDQTTRPRRIDFVHATEGLAYKGIYRVEGDTWVYHVVGSDEESARPKDFDSPNATHRVNKRKRP